MDEKFINSIINKYKSFRKSLEELIKSKIIKLKNKDCYLITDCWDIELNKMIKSYESNKKFKKSNIHFTLPKQNPEFINNIPSFVEFIKKQQKFKLISKDFIDEINEKANLNICQNTPVTYYTGNNKIIIEFKDKNENIAVLINYPLLNYFTLYFIEIKKDEIQKNILYFKILSIEKFKENVIKEKFNNTIYTKKEFINNKTKCFPTNYKKKINSISKNKGNKKRENINYNIRQKQDSKKKYSLIDSNIFTKRSKNRTLSKEKSINSLTSYSSRRKIRYRTNRKIKNNTKGDVNDSSQISISINLCDNNNFNPSTPKINYINPSFGTNNICNISFSKESQKKKTKIGENHLVKIKSENIKNKLNESKKNEEEVELYNNELIEENNIININEKEYSNEFFFTKKKTIESDQEINDKNRIFKNLQKDKLNSKEKETFVIKNKNENEYLKKIAKLEKELNNEKQEKNDLKKELDKEKQINIDLKKKLDNEKQVNANLKKENENLKKNENEYINKIKESQKYNLNEEQKEFIKKLQNDLNNQNNINENNKKVIEYLNDKINQKENEITKLKKEMMSINFISTDGNIQYSIPCFSSDTFAEIEEKLYKKYPSYRETDNYFVYNGSRILRFKTLAENKIENGLPITLVKFN